MHIRIGLVWCCLVFLALAARVHGTIWNNGLATEEFMRENDYIPFASSTAPYYAILQTDGNFCVYPGTPGNGNPSAVWCSIHTAQPTGSYFAILQTDGNFCVYSGTGPHNTHGGVWCSMALSNSGSFTLTLGYCGVLTAQANGVTYWSSPADFGAEATCRPPNSGIAWTGLTTGQFMRENDYIPFASSTAPYFAILQTDGNFCVYSGTPGNGPAVYLWCSIHASQPAGSYFAILQTDGNFCVYSGTGPSNNHGVVWCSMALNSGTSLTLGACGVLAAKANSFTYWSTPAANNCHP